MCLSNGCHILRLTRKAEDHRDQFRGAFTGKHRIFIHHTESIYHGEAPMPTVHLFYTTCNKGRLKMRKLTSMQRCGPIVKSNIILKRTPLGSRPT
jgi:hypothetical protein